MVRRLCTLVALCLSLTLCASAQSNIIKKGVEGVGKSGSKAITKAGSKAAAKIPNTTMHQVERSLMGKGMSGTMVEMGGRGTGPSTTTGQGVTAGKAPFTGQQGGQLPVKGTDVVEKVKTKSKEGSTTEHSSAILEAKRRELAEAFAQYDLSTAIGKQQEFQTGIGRSVLYVPNTALEKDPDILQYMDEAVRGYSMTIVKTNYQGLEEIFGVIPTHSLPDWKEAADKMFGITKKFHAEVILPDGTKKLIPAEVVQISAHSMFDVSLVKFNPEDEVLLRPLQLADTPAKEGEKLLLYGNANGNPILFDRTVGKKSFISLRTDMIRAPGDQRQGFCGSPWLDLKGELQAVHTGSLEEREASYGTNTFFIKKLVEAYHNGGKATYDLILDGEVLTSLNIDEYISAFGVADESKSIIYKKDGLERSKTDKFGKYSEAKIREAINMPQARYLILHSRTPRWQKSISSGEFYLQETRNDMNVDFYNLREHVYDLKTHKVEVKSIMDDPEEEAILNQLDGYPVRKP